jgi:glycosyltransferase involved in cell wall biosynthesis
MGGASTRVSNAIKGLKSRGHQVFVVTAFPHYPHGNVPREYRTRAFAVEGDEQVRVFRVWVPPLPHESAKRLVMYLSFTLFSLVALPFCGKVDVVWALSPNYFSSVTGIFYKMVKRKPLVLDVVDLWPEALVNLGFLKSKFLVGLVNVGVDLFYRVSDGIITLNSGMKREILRREKDSSKVFIVENVVDLDVFRPLNVQRPEFLRGKFVVMYSGNLGPMYDFGTVLEAAKALSGFEDVVFVLRGSGERLDMIKSGIKEFGLDNVFVFDKVFDVKEVAEFLNMADVLFLPMKKLDNAEVSFPIKLIEYLACGKPVVCCAEGETAKLACESKAGFVVSPSDSKALSEMILKLYCNKDHSGKLGKNGRAFSEDFFSHQGMAVKLENFFVELEQ